MWDSCILFQMHVQLLESNSDSGSPQGVIEAVVHLVLKNPGFHLVLHVYSKIHIEVDRLWSMLLT